jgi:hypothetical protein
MALSEEERRQAMIRIAAGLKILVDGTELTDADWYTFTVTFRFTDENVDFGSIQLETRPLTR